MDFSSVREKEVLEATGSVTMVMVMLVRLVLMRSSGEVG